MISVETYANVLTNNVSKINEFNTTDDLKYCLSIHNQVIRNMGKRLRDTEHPLDKSLVSDYVLNYELSRLFAKLIRNKIKNSFAYTICDFDADANKLWNKYEKGELKWKNED